MADEEAQRLVILPSGYKRLRISIVEQAILVAMVLVLAMTCVDALNGQHVGKSDALRLAKLQGQQELMAQKLK